MFILSFAHWNTWILSKFEPYDKRHEEYNIQPKHQVLVVCGAEHTNLVWTSSARTSNWCRTAHHGGGAEPGPGFSASPRSGLRAAACLASRPSTQPAAADTEKCFAQQKLDRAGGQHGRLGPASTAVPANQRTRRHGSDTAQPRGTATRTTSDHRRSTAQPPLVSRHTAARRARWHPVTQSSDRIPSSCWSPDCCTHSPRAPCLLRPWSGDGQGHSVSVNISVHSQHEAQYQQQLCHLVNRGTLSLAGVTVTCWGFLRTEDSGYSDTSSRGRGRGSDSGLETVGTPKPVLRGLILSSSDKKPHNPGTAWQHSAYCCSLCLCVKIRMTCCSLHHVKLGNVH